MSYTETEAYQKEIAEQYKERNLELKPQEVGEILHALGFEVDEASITEAEAGNMNATFLTDQYVLKVSNDADSVAYSANHVVSEGLPDEKVVRVVAHDVRKKTGYEVLVMERAPGAMWLKDMATMPEEENRALFEEVLQVAKASHGINPTDKFGWVTDIQADSEKNGFDTFRAQLEARLDAYLLKIKEQEDMDQEAVEQAVAYARKHLHLFENERASFVHSDLHMGNVMHQDGGLTAVIDWDSTQSVPSYVGLIPLIGLIDNPGQFVEGTPDYESYKGKKFEYLYPTLKQAFAEELEDDGLELKMNVLGIIGALMWVSEDWSREWNKEMVANLVNKEVSQDGDVSRTYYGETIAKLRTS